MRTATFLLLLSASPVALQAQNDVVLNAMRDEMARSMKQLSIESGDKPYFISYRIVDSETTSVAAAFGALNHSNANRSRRLTVEVRVGDYKLDNSHFFSFNFDMGTRLQIFNGTTSLPLEDDYKELRRQLWLATDATYKKAVEDLSKKRGLLQSESHADDPDDFSKEDPVTTSFELPAVKIDIPGRETEARALSAVFRQMPGIYTSRVLFNTFNTYTRYLTSEGTTYTRREPDLVAEVDAGTQATDGTQLNDLFWIHGRSQAEMPSRQDLEARLRTMAQTLTQLRDAPTLPNYNGPVLVEGEAAPELIRYAILPNLTGSSRTISSMPGIVMNNQNQPQENPYLDKIGGRVLPDFLSVTDNPLIDQYQGHRLDGFSKVDEDGMLPRETRLIENGILKTLLTTREPVRGIAHTTGSRHIGQASPTNVIVTAANGLSAADLRVKFLALVKQRNLPFGIVVRKLSSANNAQLAFKVYPDGHEEPIRSIQFFGLNANSFRDIIAASSEPNFLTMRYVPPRNGQFPVASEGDEIFTPVSMVVPSLLFEDATMRRNRAAAPNPPVAGHPFFDK